MIIRKHANLKYDTVSAELNNLLSKLALMSYNSDMDFNTTIDIFEMIRSIMRTLKIDEEIQWAKKY